MKNFFVFFVAGVAAINTFDSEFVDEINGELSSVRSVLRCCTDQYNGQVYYGLVNNVSNEQSEQSNLGTKDSDPHIAFFKSMVSVDKISLSSLLFSINYKFTYS